MKKLSDHKLKLRPIKVKYLNGSRGTGTAKGNNAAGTCGCGELLVGRCYFQFGHTCHTTCSGCGRTYRVSADQTKKAETVVEGAG